MKGFIAPEDKPEPVKKKKVQEKPQLIREAKILV